MARNKTIVRLENENLSLKKDLYKLFSDSTPFAEKEAIKLRWEMKVKLEDIIFYSAPKQFVDMGILSQIKG